AGTRVLALPQRRRGWHKGHLANTAHAVRMTWIGDFDQHRVNHRQVESRRHTIVQEARIDHIPSIVVDKLLVQGPTDPLHRPTLDLAFHIARVNGFAHVLHRLHPHHRDFPSLTITLT